jgi:hypothetical protein
VFAITSPFGVAVIWAAASYSAGKARLWTVGLPTVELANVSPSTRLQTVSSGCLVSGGEWAIQVPNNAMLLVMTSLFGAMPGAYDGPYPSDAEVDEALRVAVPVPLAAVQADRVIVGGREVRLRPGLGGRLVDATMGSLATPPAPRGSILKGRVLALRFFGGDDEEYFPAPVLILIDTETGKVIAYRGATLQRRLPRQWT